MKLIKNVVVSDDELVIYYKDNSFLSVDLPIELRDYISTLQEENKLLKEQVTELKIAINNCYGVMIGLDVITNFELTKDVEVL